MLIIACIPKNRFYASRLDILKASTINRAAIAIENKLFFDSHHILSTRNS